MTFFLSSRLPSLISGPHDHAVHLIEESVKFVVWWFGLGVLSSVGLGTGMHTGVLFVFPHIFKVCGKFGTTFQYNASFLSMSFIGAEAVW